MMIQYFRNGEYIGDDMKIGEYKNDLEDGRCPFCHRQVKTIICEYDGIADIPIGCFHCIDSTDEPDEMDWEEIMWLERERAFEERMLCRGTAYER